MTTILSELLYNEHHLWLREDGDGVYIVGLSDYAQSQLGNVIFVELPEKGDTVITGDECAMIESEKTASDLFAPISGEIIEINPELLESPTLINSDPYFDGWIYKIEASDESELEELLNNEEYEEILPLTGTEDEEEEFEELED